MSTIQTESTKLPESAPMPQRDQDRSEYMLAARGIAKTYTRGIWPRRRHVRVLNDAELTLGRGEIVGLVGENGSGKSTLMRILVGSIDRDAGIVEKNGSLGYCPQEPILYERLTCDEHFQLFGRAAAWATPRSTVPATTSTRSRVHRLAQVAGGKLSGGTGQSSTGSRPAATRTC
jgi:ABC-type multidrug transport system ATPase subunit